MFKSVKFIILSLLTSILVISSSCNDNANGDEPVYVWDECLRAVTTRITVQLGDNEKSSMYCNRASYDVYSKYKYFNAAIFFDRYDLSIPVYEFIFHISDDLIVGRTVDVSHIAFADPYDIVDYGHFYYDEPSGTCRVDKLTNDFVTLEFKNFKLVRRYSTGFQQNEFQETIINGKFVFFLE